MTSGGYLDLIIVILAGMVIIGVAFDCLRRILAKPSQDRYYTTVVQPRLSIGQSARLEKRLSQLHVIDDSGGEHVRIVR